MSLIIMEEEDDKYSTLKMLEKRQIGKQFLKLDTLRSKYYRHMKMSWIGEEKHGGIFNMEFSPNGKVLMVACERCAILTYDPLSRKCIQRLPTAHTDCVNCICFFNEHIFASGSDDCTIALWDTRMLREKVKQLSGHTSWVKSLVYVASTEMLLSSAFDGTVRMWDIDGSSTAENDVSVTIFKAKDVSRMDLTPEGDKMIISCLTDLSYDKVIIFHNLDLSNFASDVADKNFGDIPEEALEDGVAKRNMPELLVADLEYPKHPLRIPSIQVHPEGSCLLSRYLSVNTDEYTTVHDIQRYAETSEGKFDLMSSQNITTLVLFKQIRNLVS